MTIRSIRIHPSAIENALRHSRTLNQALQPTAAKATRLARQVAGERTRRHTGKYEAGFKSRVDSASGPHVVRIVTENKVPYARFLESGSRPHLIRVRNARVLYNHETNTFFGTQVRHPGTKPLRVIELALKRLAGKR